jgi:NAD-dependent dihydropyrimidine dehydrogenase PreA subunit
MAFVIAEPCIGVKDTSCVDACPVDYIHPRKTPLTMMAVRGSTMFLYIDPVECIDCGACVPACPVSAIFANDDLPEKVETLRPNKRKLREGWQIHEEEYAKHQVAK